MRRITVFVGALVASGLGAVPAFATDEQAPVAMATSVPSLLPLAGVVGVILVAGFGYRKAGG